MTTTAHTQIHPLRTSIVSVAVLAAVFAAAAGSGRSSAGLAQQPKTAGARRVSASDVPTGVRAWTIHYRSHAGHLRDAVVLLPTWYGPHRHPSIPLVISPHGRGGTGEGNAKLWGNLPALGRFAVVNPDGDGRRLLRFSWGADGQIDDLARMPEIVTRALSWLRIDRRRVYALGGSMGGQETLLLVARHPRMLAGASAWDSLVDFAYQYEQFPRFACDSNCRLRWGGPRGVRLQWLARREVGGSAERAPAAFARRSPIAAASAIAASGVPLQIWWSRCDEVVLDADRQSRRLVDELRVRELSAEVQAIEGKWAHSAEMRASRLLPSALVGFGLLDKRFDRLPAGSGIRTSRLLPAI